MRAREMPGAYASLRVVADEGDVKLVGKQNVPASFTHWSFGQLCSRVGAPPEFLRDLPATLASNVLNNRLAEKGEKVGECKLLLDVNGSATVRAFTGTGYARIWDQDITKRLIALGEKGWFPAPETTLAGGGKTRGLYASDRDMFALVVDDSRRVFEKLPGGGLSRGAIFSNGECGDRKFRMWRFLYAWICGNHNIYGVQDVQEVEVTHIGNAAERAFGEYEVVLKQYMEGSAAEDEAGIEKSMKLRVGETKEEVLDTLFAKLGTKGLSRKVLGEAWVAAEEHEGWYGDPRSAWGIGNGVTEVARGMVYADERVRVERAAGLVFAGQF